MGYETLLVSHLLISASFHFLLFFSSHWSVLLFCGSGNQIQWTLPCWTFALPPNYIFSPVTELLIPRVQCCLSTSCQKQFFHVWLTPNHPWISAWKSFPLEQQISTFLMLQPFNSISHSVVVPNHKIISLLLHNFKFSIIMNHNINVWYAEYVNMTPMKGSFNP